MPDAKSCGDGSLCITCKQSAISEASVMVTIASASCPCFASQRRVVFSELFRLEARAGWQQWNDSTFFNLKNSLTASKHAAAYPSELECGTLSFSGQVDNFTRSALQSLQALRQRKRIVRESLSRRVARTGWVRSSLSSFCRTLRPGCELLGPWRVHLLLVQSCGLCQDMAPDASCSLAYVTELSAGGLCRPIAMCV